MEFLLTTKSTETPGPKIRINCPRCGAKKARASSYEQQDKLSLFYVLPLFGLTNTFVRCSECKAKLTSQVSIEELDELSVSELSESLSDEVSIVVKFLAIASAVLCIIPYVGLGLSVLTVVLSLKAGGWTRKVGLITLVLSALIAIVSTVFLMSE